MSIILGLCFISEFSIKHNKKIKNQRYPTDNKEEDEKFHRERESVTNH